MTSVLPPGSSGEETGCLRDGTPVRVRDALPSDRPRVLEFLRHTSMHSLELRFLAVQRPEIVASEILTPRGPVDRVSLLLELPGPAPSPVIAHGEYVADRSDPSRAEVAFLVADDRQGLGAATLLLEHLARRARSAGIRRFDAVVRPDNPGMIGVFIGAGFPYRIVVRDRLERVSLDIRRAPEARALPPDPPGLRPPLRA